MAVATLNSCPVDVITPYAPLRGDPVVKGVVRRGGRARGMDAVHTFWEDFLRQPLAGCNGLTSIAPLVGGFTFAAARTGGGTYLHEMKNRGSCV